MSGFELQPLFWDIQRFLPFHLFSIRSALSLVSNSRDINFAALIRMKYLFVSDAFWRYLQILNAYLRENAIRELAVENETFC